ncbi:Predicted amidohydrolase [Arsukibacterium tuosuense]|uniref:Omega-amidase YafV n=1 Tax=Arsukibacterium tuosuense TaxID=1323745 RepID=A0A285JIL5_9GAMM|nr:amidohydrolase [Arsukibacterium tuosuense]SNY59637.1 Predicted amidohydrolase [Arsukibacterium tuosuense]
MSAVKVSLLQTTLHWQDSKANLAHFSQLLAGLPVTDLVVLPEMFTTGFSMQSAEIAEQEPGPGLAWLTAQAKAINAAITGSLAVKTAAGGYVNRLYFVTPDGAVSYYDKKHLFRMAGEHQAYQAGQQRVIVRWRGLRFCLQVCYDLRFPVFSRNLNDYDVLIYVANWPAARRHAWSSLLVARAIENQAFVLAVNRIGQDGNDIHYSGDSVVIDYQGQLAASLSKGEAGVLSANLDGSALAQYRQAFPAHLDADRFRLD